MDESKVGGSKEIGLIPDFFHDIIAYLLPGMMFLLLVVVDLLILNVINFDITQKTVTWVYLASLVFSYVVGRFYEEVGLLLFHYRAPKIIEKITGFRIKPKWALLFDAGFNKYTNTFKTYLKKRLGDWFKRHGGNDLIIDCENNKTDDYFNVIQFYLRERFPAIALYEKKQNATIILSRSLALIFISNVMIYHAILLQNIYWFQIEFKFWSVSSFYIFSQVVAAAVFYSRFIRDKNYHAMYILEAFIATRKLVKSKSQTPNQEQNHSGHEDEL